jgi:hypothetical protein
MYSRDPPAYKVITPRQDARARALPCASDVQERKERNTRGMGSSDRAQAFTGRQKYAISFRMLK